MIGSSYQELHHGHYIEAEENLKITHHAVDLEKA
jgi:hypothetical protein